MTSSCSITTRRTFDVPTLESIVTEVMDKDLSKECWLAIANLDSESL